jgi:hypothetical protein
MLSRFDSTIGSVGEVILGPFAGAFSSLPITPANSDLAGWDEAILKMSLGERAVLYIPQ